MVQIDIFPLLSTFRKIVCCERKQAKETEKERRAEIFHSSLGSDVSRCLLPKGAGPGSVLFTKATHTVLVRRLFTFP